jgi:hypothetical protein
LLERDPQLESRPTFLFFKGAANGLFSEGSERLSRGVNDQQAYLIGIRCERGSHRFFKKYGERFEDSEGKQVFLEFAQEERVHLELLIANTRRWSSGRAARAAARRPRSPVLRQQAGLPRASAPSSLIDLHTHTQASDGRLSPRDLVEQAWLAGIRVLGITDHDTIGGLAAAYPAGREFGVRIGGRRRGHGDRERARRSRARLPDGRQRRAVHRVSRRAAAGADHAHPRDRRAARGTGCARGRRGAALGTRRR